MLKFLKQYMKAWDEDICADESNALDLLLEVGSILYQWLLFKGAGKWGWD